VTAPGPGIGSELRAVTSAGARNVWAVGLFELQSPQGTEDLTLTEHWNGKTWAIVGSPSPTGDDSFDGVAAVSADDIWAVGDGGGQGLVARWNGRAWALVPAPRRDHSLDLLFAVSAPSATDIWAAGDDIDLHDYSNHTLIEDICGT
jgi:hypothetical protein